MKQLFSGNKKRIRMGILASFLAASFGLAIFTPVQAAYPVFDSKNIAEAVKILQQAQKQVAKLTEHIKIATGQLDVLKTQIKNLQDMKKELTGLWSEIERTRAESKALITSTRKEMKGLLAPINGHSWRY
jgi:septal ring factor EnvC (AmiA/AmiB activator)